MSQIGFIGAGRMASAMVEGILRDQVFQANEVACTCGDDPTGPDLAARTGISYQADLNALVTESDVIVLACKPQQFAGLDESLNAAAEGKLVISILAGTTLERLNKKFPLARNIVRSMPNTPGQIGAGITGFASFSELSAQDGSTVTKILESLGTVVSLEEKQLDAVTAVSGSGPAYIFEFTAGLREAAEKSGLDSVTADALARETLIGAALLMQQSKIDPVELRKMVTSPGGTTQAALESFEEDGLRNIISRAVEAACKRSVELAKA
ncbi:pyrroline-5-carboxylate reductase [Rubellicoccus peritrichatus]|uniref:Pyrroline-5-carboxylate reductase n=1 Tax=Rubellicoccus peritrichatus TaxID=3080537 RepID=A0AAQ3LBY5_9BACT|nr:pyrroline-5-carboxylate reductase [Puniceicoccus sp. CR14]WOO43289.1 pyrroline-5-carboxylate reductase [Puniceicoccus sp. CR14]